jgi:hypothetical protein
MLANVCSTSLFREFYGVWKQLASINSFRGHSNGQFLLQPGNLSLKSVERKTFSEVYLVKEFPLLLTRCPFEFFHLETDEKISTKAKAFNRFAFCG